MVVAPARDSQGCSMMELTMGLTCCRRSLLDQAAVAVVVEVLLRPCLQTTRDHPSQYQLPDPLQLPRRQQRRRRRQPRHQQQQQLTKRQHAKRQRTSADKNKNKNKRKQRDEERRKRNKKRRLSDRQRHWSCKRNRLPRSKSVVWQRSPRNCKEKRKRSERRQQKRQQQRRQQQLHHPQSHLALHHLQLTSPMQQIFSPH